MTQTAGAYYRVSTARQAKDGYSLEEQRERAHQWAKDHDLELSRDHEWQDAESGAKSTRENYQLMLAAAQRGEFSVLLTRDISRFGREQWETVSRIGQLVALDMTVHEIKTAEANSEARVIQKDDALSFIMTMIGAHVADSERKSIVRNSKQGQQAAFNAGAWMTKPPFGYRKAGRAIAIDETQAAVVRDIFDWYVSDNLSMQSIVRRLLAAKTPGRKWCIETIRSILVRPVYKGVSQWGEFSVEGSMPVIIDAELWRRAELRRGRKAELPARSQDTEHLLTGLLRCGTCGHAYIGKQNRSRGRIGARSYICNQHRWGACPQKLGMHAERLEKIVIDMVKGRFEGGMEPPGTTAANDLQRLQHELELAIAQRAETERQRERLIRAALRGGGDLILEVAEKELAEQDSLIEELTAAVEVAQRRLGRAELASQLSSTEMNIDGLTLTQKKAMVQQLVESITIYDDGREPQVRLTPID